MIFCSKGEVVRCEQRAALWREQSSSREYLEKYRFADKVPLVFCALHRWCHNDKLVSPACLERECVVWYDGEKCFERERKRELEIFKVKRNYEEFVERLELERNNKKNEYLPNNETETPVDEVKGENITYPMLTDNTNGDWTKLTNIEQVYEPIKGIRNDVEVVVYYNNINKLDINKNDLCYKYVRLLFDDMG